MLSIVMKSRKEPKYSETERLDFSQVHIDCYLLLFDSILMVYEGLCGEISIFFA